MDEVLRLAAPAEGMPPEARQELIAATCESVDAVEAFAGTEEDVYEYLMTRFPNSLAYRIEAEGLVANLAAVGSTDEAVVVLGRAALCQWAAS